MLSVVLGKEPGGHPCCLGCRVLAASVTAQCKTKAERYFCFLPFPIKVKISRLLLVSKNRYGCRPFIKVSGVTQAFKSTAPYAF